MRLARGSKVLTKAHPCGFGLWNNLQEFKRPLWSRDGTLVFGSDHVYTAWSDSGMDEGAVWTDRHAVTGHIWKEIILSVCFKLALWARWEEFNTSGWSRSAVNHRLELVMLSGWKVINTLLVHSLQCVMTAGSNDRGNKGWKRRMRVRKEERWYKWKDKCERQRTWGEERYKEKRKWTQDGTPEETRKEIKKWGKKRKKLNKQRK